tara:strand:+ start:159 stop:2171 length:2013 start_codon:yes stop_codon:yes gene_type:complete
MQKLIISLGIIISLVISVPFFVKDFLIRKEFLKVQKDEGVSIFYQKSKIDIFSFPTITIKLSNVILENETFEQLDKLGEIKEVTLSLSFLEIFNSKPSILNLRLQGGNVNLKIDKTGIRNFDFITKKTNNKQEPTRVKHFEINGFDVSYVDQEKSLNLTVSVEGFEWEENESISVDTKVLIKEFSIQGKRYYSDKKLNIRSDCYRNMGEIVFNVTKIKLGQLELTLEQLNNIEWHIFSNSSYLEDYFELLPDFASPVSSHYSSNEPLLFDVFVKRGKVKTAKIQAKHIVLKNDRLGTQVDEINFDYKFKKRDSKLNNVLIKGLGTTIAGSVMLGNIKENDIMSSLNGEVDIEGIVVFFLGESYSGRGEMEFITDISRKKKKLDAKVDFKDIELRNKKGDLIFQLNGEVRLTPNRLFLDSIIINPLKENLLLEGIVNDPINYFLLNQLAVTGGVSFSSDDIELFKDQYKDVNVQFDFGFVPSKKYLYIAGLPIDPLVSPTFLKIKAFDFIQPSVNNEEVHLAMNYDTDDEVHLKEFRYQVGDTTLVIELISNKPNNLALFAFEKQKFWYSCTYNKFRLEGLLRRVGLNSDKTDVLTGSFESVIRYQPTQLFSGERLIDVEFEGLVADLVINKEQIIATGDASYVNSEIDLKEIQVSKTGERLLQDFLSSFF